MIRAKLIRFDGTVEDVEIPGSDEPSAQAEAFRALIGGWMEIINIADNICMVLDEEGKLKQKPPNEFATLLASGRIALTDFIVGDVVVCGMRAPLDDEEGIQMSDFTGDLTSRRQTPPVVDEMLDMDGPEATFEVGRTAEAQDRDGLSGTISQKAMDALVSQMGMWVATRIMRFQEDNGIMPQNVTVTLNVDLTP